MDGAQKIPVSQTEFAKDKTFGFNNSDMGKYIEEKQKADTGRETVCSSMQGSRTRSRD